MLLVTAAAALMMLPAANDLRNLREDLRAEAMPLLPATMGVVILATGSTEIVTNAQVQSCEQHDGKRGLKH